MKEHISLLMEGKPGLLVMDSRSSKYGYEGMRKCKEVDRCPDNRHIFGWRDFFDIIVRWRQVIIIIITLLYHLLNFHILLLSNLF